MKKYFCKQLMKLGLCEEDEIAVKILTAIYGLPEAELLWRNHLHEVLIKIGLIQCLVAKCLYYYRKYDLIVGVHVDDMMAGAPRDEFIDLFEQELEEYFKVTSRNDSLLGMKLNYMNEGILINQPLYIDGLLKRYDPSNLLYAKRVPMAAGYKVNLENAEASALKIIGSLLHIARFGRWDVLFAVNYIASAPTQEAGLKVLQYLKGTRDNGFLFKFIRQGTPTLVAFSDSEFNRDFNSTSTGGHRLRLTSSVIYDVEDSKKAEFVLEESNADFLISSRKHKVATDSAPFSEFLQLYLCFKDVVWIRNVLEFVNMKQTKPTVIFSDSSTSIDILTNGRAKKKRSHHWNPKLFMMNQAVKDGIIQVIKIGTEKNPADALTKPLPEIKFKQHLASSGYLNCTPDLKTGKEGVEVNYAGIKTADGKSIKVAGHQVTVPDLACMANIDPDSHSGGAKCRHEENNLLVDENDLLDEEIDLLTR